MSIVPSLQRLDHRQPVVFGAQRRRELEEGAVLADVVLVERQIVDRDAGGDVGAVGFGARDRLGRMRGRDLGGVIAAAGQPRERQVALERDGLGFARNAGEAEPAGEKALVHDAAGAEVAFSRLMRDDGAEVARIGHGPAQHQRVAMVGGHR